MAFGGFQNNAVEITGGNCIFSYDPMNTGSYNSAGIPGTSTSPLGVSINFNGTSQYLTYNPTFLNGTTTSVTFGSNSFTVEAWVYVSSLATNNRTIVDARGGATNSWAWYINQTSGTVSWLNNGAIVLTSTGGVSVNMWTHVAYVRNGTTGTMYINGVASGSTTDSANYSLTPTTVTIGASSGGASTRFTGQMTNIRISNGTAVYTTNFTPPNQPLTSGGSSLCLLALTSSGFLTDSSPNNYTITNNGTAVYSTNTPFQVTPGSFYFDGSTYITCTSPGTAFNFGTNPFTIEYWLYGSNTATGSAQHITDFRTINTSTAYADYLSSGDGHIQVEYNTSGGAAVALVASNIAINNDSWNHVAWGRTSSGNTNIWINGVLAGSQAANVNQTSGNLCLGSQSPGIGTGFQLKGYLAQMRVSNVQVYTSNNFGAPAYLNRTANTTFLFNTYTASTANVDSSINAVPMSITGNNIFGGQNYGPYANVIGDLSGQQNTGSLQYAVGNTAPIWYSNKDGYWALTGGLTNKQYITESVPQLNPSANVASGGPGASTLGFWMQVSGAANGAPIATFVDSKIGNNSGGNYGPWMFINAGNGISYSQYDGVVPTGGKIASASGNVNDGNWHYIAGTFTSPGNINLYVDGSLASSASWGGGGAFTGYWRFGGNPENVGGSPWGVPGSLANSYTAVNFGPIHAHNTALNANQIAQNYNMVKARYTNTGNQTFSYTGNVQTFQVPTGVTLVNATVTGAAGGKPISSFGNVGNASGTVGGAGAVISGTIPVTPGQILTLVVGRGGQDYSTYNSSATGNVYIGGPGGPGSTVSANTQVYGGNGGAGGGFSGIFNSATPTQFSAIMIAGGGGGGSGWNGYAASGGNAANAIANTAVAGLNNPGILPQWGGAPIANISGNGTVVTVNFSASITGNVNGTTGPFTPYVQGQPVSLYGATSPFASKTGYVLTASPSQITYYSSDTGSQSPSGAYVWSQGLTAGSGGAPAYPGGFGYIFDYGVNNTWGTGGAALSGGAGSTTFNSTWTGGGGGGGGYYGGGGGSSGGAAVGGGGGGSNYVNPVVQSPTFLSLTGVNSNLTAQHGSIRLNW